MPIGTRLTTLVLAVLATLGLGIGAVAATTFTDVPTNHPHKEHIDWLVDNGIATGFDDGTFRPGNPVTRGQAARWFHVYNGTTHLVSETVNAPSASTAFVRNVACPAGDRVLGGGGHMSNSGLYLSDSYPLTPEIWSVTWRTVGGGNATPSQFTVWALCGPAD